MYGIPATESIDLLVLPRVLDPLLRVRTGRILWLHPRLSIVSGNRFNPQLTV